MQDFCVYVEVFRDGSANPANQILPRLTHIAMEMEFEIKWAITRHMYEISPRFLHLTRGFEGGANK